MMPIVIFITFLIVQFWRQSGGDGLGPPLLDELFFFPCEDGIIHGILCAAF